MRIVVDMQGAQTESRFRGIGRYTLSLTQAIVRNRGEHEIILVLNGLFSQTIEPIRAAFEGVLFQENIRVWYAPGPVKESEPGNDHRREVAEMIREAFFASLSPDVVLVSSFFEGYSDDAVTSTGRFPISYPTVAILYDLIPLVEAEAYLNPNPQYSKHYHQKIEHLKKSSMWMAISECSAQEGVSLLRLPEDAVVNISTACDAVFKKMEIAESEKKELLEQFSICKPFVLYSGGADSRKNLLGLIRAYAKLPLSVRDHHQLVFAGNMPQGNVVELMHTAKKSGLQDGELVFTGYVSDSDLNNFYNLCELFIFPSFREGFGLPALEAMSCGAPVIAEASATLKSLDLIRPVI